MTPQQIVAKIWSYCQVPRDTGVGTLDYVEQITYLLFLKMADEQFQLTGKRVVPKGYDWPSLLALDGDELEDHYKHVLEHLGKQSGAIGAVFQKATNRVNQPAVLRTPGLLLDDAGQNQRFFGAAQRAVRMFLGPRLGQLPVHGLGGLLQHHRYRRFPLS